MATDVQTKKYNCPKCGKKHAADLSALEGHPEIHGKVRCMQCHELLWLSLGDDGSPRVEIYADHLREGEAGAAAPKSQPESSATTASSTATAGKPSSIGPILIAALVAAIVSFVVGQATGSNAGSVSGSASTTDAAPPEQLTALQGDIENLRSDASAVAMAQTKLEAELRSAATAQSESLSGLKTTLAEIQTSLDGLQGRLDKIEKLYTSLHGRIEMNYTNLRTAKKRLDALAAEEE